MGDSIVLGLNWFKQDFRKVVALYTGSTNLQKPRNNRIQFWLVLGFKFYAIVYASASKWTQMCGDSSKHPRQNQKACHIAKLIL